MLKTHYFCRWEGWVTLQTLERCGIFLFWGGLVWRMGRFISELRKINVHVCKFVFLQLAHLLEWAALFVYLPNLPDSPFVFISRIFCFIYNEINIYMLCKSSRGKLAFLIRCQIHVGIAIILHPSVLLDLFIVTANHLLSCMKRNCKAYTLSKKPVNCETTILSDLACRMCVLE